MLVLLHVERRTHNLDRSANMYGRTRVSDALAATGPGEELVLKGWVRTVRVGKDVTFIALNDGSSLASLQVVVEPALPNYQDICRLGTGSAVVIRGTLQESPAAG